MQIDDRLGIWEDLCAIAGTQSELLGRIRSMMWSADPDGVEAVSLKQKNVWWGTGPSKMQHGHSYAAPFAGHTNLGFFHGVELPDPQRHLEGSGKKLRHVKLVDAGQLELPAVHDLIAAAVAERRAYS